MAARHGTREADVDRLLRDGVFVDLYPIVRRALRVGSRSYSIKKLEPLYMGDEVRTSDVQKGDDSIVRYVEARALRDDGADAAAQEIFDDLADYNRYDCVSTRRLRDWLVDRARDAGLRPSPNPEPGENVYEPSARALALAALALEHARRLRRGAWRCGSVPPAIDYYPREAKTFWATHFLRLREPVSLWEETRDVVVLDPDALPRASRTGIAPRAQRADRRILELRGELAPGTRLSEGSNPFALYELPAPFPFEPSPRWIHADHRVTVIEVLDDGALVEETAVDGFTWTELPIALTPPPPPRALQPAGARSTRGRMPSSRRRRSFPPTRPPTSCAAARSRTLGPSSGLPASHRRRRRRDRPRASSTSTTATSPCRARPARARPTSARTSSPGSCASAGTRSASSRSRTPSIENMLDRIVAAGVPRELVGEGAEGPRPPATSRSRRSPRTASPTFTAEHAGSRVRGRRHGVGLRATRGASRAAASTCS